MSIRLRNLLNGVHIKKVSGTNGTSLAITPLQQTTCDDVRADNIFY
jgi:hypothetical protein